MRCYNSPPPSDILTLDPKIWTRIATQGKVSLRTPNKTKYSPRHTLSLGVTKLSDRVHTQTINHTTRYLRNEGPHHFSTCDTNGNPRLFYKCLGTYFFNKQHHQNMLALLTNIVTSFNNLTPLPLTHTEIIKLSNIQLI